MQICGTCKKKLDDDKFFRNYHKYKTCNTCDKKQDKYKVEYALRKKKTLNDRIFTHLKNMYNAVKSKNKYRMIDCAKAIYTFMRYRTAVIIESNSEKIAYEISEAWKNKDKKRMTESLYMLIDYVEKIPQI